MANDIVDRLKFTYDGDQLSGGDSEIAAELQRRYPQELGKYIHAARAISAGLPSFKSIDDYLYTHSSSPETMTVGKMAIVRSIGHYERKSTLSPLWSPDPDERENGLSTLRKSWAHTLIQTLVTGVRREDKDQLFKDLTIINFNYDRCIETVLFHGIQAPLQIDDSEAARVLDGLKIYRPYGGLGPLLQQGLEGVPFGPEAGRAVQIGDRIRVYTEAVEESTELEEMRERLGLAEQIVFLGFGFHAQNMQLLDIGAHKNRGGRRVLATIYETPTPAQQVFISRIRSALIPATAPDLANASFDCARAMRDYAITF